MKVDFNKQFTDFHGKAMEGEANNIREAVCASLFSYNGKGDEKYKAYINAILKPIYKLNKQDKTADRMFNTEFVPSL